ncbi:MAG: LysR family transcriptional regulator [Pseudomonadota bacterium]
MNSLNNLRDMALFVAVAEAGSLTAAALNAGVPKATLSRRILAMEARLGVALFHRGARKLTPTAEGSWYLTQAQSLVAQADVLNDGLRGNQAAAAGLVRICTSPDVGQHLLGPVLSAFMARYPQIELDIDLTPRYIDLAEQSCDIAIRTGLQADSKLYARKLADLPRQILAAPSYLARAGVPDGINDLARHTCIRFKGRGLVETHWPLQSGDEKLLLPVHGGLLVNTVGMAQALLENGSGLGLIIPDFCASALADGRLQRVLPEWSGVAWPVYAVMRERRQPARVRLLLDYMAEAFL